MSGYQLSSLARLDLRKIWTFSAERWGRRKADSYLQEIEAAIEAIAKDHHLGHGFDPLDPTYRRVFVGSHAVFYRIATERLWVVRILHQAMDAGSRLN